MRAPAGALSTLSITALLRARKLNGLTARIAHMACYGCAGYIKILSVPRQSFAAEDMDVQVKHGLTCIRALIYD